MWTPAPAGKPHDGADGQGELEGEYRLYFRAGGWGAPTGVGVAGAGLNMICIFDGP